MKNNNISLSLVMAITTILAINTYAEPVTKWKVVEMDKVYTNRPAAIAVCESGTAKEISSDNNEYQYSTVFPTNVEFKFWKKEDNTWRAMTDVEKDAVLSAEQLAKPIGLKVLENIYITFLTNEWTTCLRVCSLIPPTYTINVTNADTTSNTTFLLQLRVLDVATNKPTYSYFKNEFSTFRENIVLMGGSNAMNNIRWHPEIVQ